jgi:ATP-dependent Clp protease ATP-binding subunit ClpC
MLKPYTYKAKQALEQAKKMATVLGHPYVGTEHLLVGLLRDGTSTAAKVLTMLGVDENKLTSMIQELIAPGDVAVAEAGNGYSPRLERVLEQAQDEAERFSAEEVGTEHLLIALVRTSDCAASRLLNTLGVNQQKMYVEILQAMGEDVSKYREDFQNGRLSRKKGGDQTPTLDRYSRDLTKMAKEGKLDPVVGRTEEIQRVIQILSRRTKNNPCLIGEPGVGKTAIAEGLAQQIAREVVPDTILNKRVVTLDLSGMVAGSKYRGEFEERIKKVIREVTDAGNVLLFVDELHTLIGAGGAEGALDASNILKPSLARGEIQLIGATTREEYRKYVEKDAALERRFQPVSVEEPTKEEALEILKGIRPKYEQHHHVTITDEGLMAAVELSIRYINDRYLPDKAIDLVDEAASRVRLRGFETPAHMEQLEDELHELEALEEQALIDGRYVEASEYKVSQDEVTEKLEKAKKKYLRDANKKNLAVGAEQIADIVALWTKIPVSRIKEAESARLLRLEKTLHKRVVGQEEAVTSVAKAVKRGRVGLKDPNRPIGSFLFLGPTGVGKTELSKALAEAMFGDEKAMIRVDMSEYMEKHSVSKMIGSPPGYVGYEEGGQLSEQVRKNPYSVILFDEIEKAHPDVFNILLQVLDDGRITDAQGRQTDFKNTVIIMTSNAGAQSIIEPKKLGFSSGEDEKQDYERMKSNVMEEVRRIFKPEFLNRIDDIIVFHALNKENMKKIVTILSKTFIARCKEQMDIDVTIRDSVKAYIVEKAYDPKYGARPLKRMLQSKIEDELAQKILEGSVKSGDSLVITMKKKEIAFEVK